MQKQQEHQNKKPVLADTKLENTAKITKGGAAIAAGASAHDKKCTLKKPVLCRRNALENAAKITKVGAASDFLRMLYLTTKFA